MLGLVSLTMMVTVGIATSKFVKRLQESHQDSVDEHADQVFEVRDTFIQNVWWIPVTIAHNNSVLYVVAQWFLKSWSADRRRSAELSSPVRETIFEKKINL